MWSISGPPGVAISAADVTWDNGERDVRTVNAGDGPIPRSIGGPRPLARLERGSRLSILRSGPSNYVELQVSRVDPESADFWSSTYKATEADFEDLMGGSWKQPLLQAGTSGIGTRETVLGDHGRRRSFLCAAFRDQDSRLPVVAYSMTRVVPLLNPWSAVHPPRDPLPNQMRVYVVRLGDAAPGPPSDLGKVYVGDTARTPEERFATHLAGGRTASNVVARHGRKLLPELYEHVPPVGHEDQHEARALSEKVEAWLADELKSMGYTVHRGSGGIHRASFAQS